MDMDLNKKFDVLLTKITNPSFLNGSSTGNEVNFHIFDYDPLEEMAVRENIKFVKEKISGITSEVNIVEFNLYEAMISILKSKGYYEKVIQMEKVKGTESIINPVKKTLRLTLDSDEVVKYIRDNTDQSRDIVFLTGVGTVWPIIRSHSILNNLHSVIDKTPLIMFFPGFYDGLELKLFGEIKDDNYYRAFRFSYE